jgi:signal transduction histidine kinase
MKLVYKNILINTVLSVLILFVGELSLYSFLKSKIEKETIEHLHIERYIMIQKLKRGVSINSFKHNIGDELTISPINKVLIKKPIIRDVIIAEIEDEIEEEHEEHHEERFVSKKIIFDVSQNNQAYRISILKATDEDEGITESMQKIILISAVSMLIILVLVNFFVFYKLFAPLNKLIRDIQKFSVQNLQKIIAPKTSTVEFNLLSKEISAMSEKMILDYRSVKEFTENITHEIQTPLAVINSKIERCLQDKNLTEEQAILLTDAARSVNKLFNINKGLTLLSKLDNKQFSNPVEINLINLIKQRLSYFTDFIENKKLNVDVNFSEDDNMIVSMKESLAEILIDNLLKNAIQHNFIDGRIIIKVHAGKLIISNTGVKPKESTDNYFTRFKSDSQQQSLGLGLSIVKKIVEYYQYSIVYDYHNELHLVTVDFKNKLK